MSISESVSGPRLPCRHWFRPPSSSIAAAARPNGGQGGLLRLGERLRAGGLVQPRDLVHPGRQGLRGAVQQAGRDDRELLQPRPAVGEREVEHGDLAVGAEQDVARGQVGVDERAAAGTRSRPARARRWPRPPGGAAPRRAGRRPARPAGPGWRWPTSRTPGSGRASVPWMSAACSTTLRQLGLVRRAAQVVEGLAGGEVHHQQPVPVVGVHVAARGVGVQPRVADARRR